jgi:hypothetical protein
MRRLPIALSVAALVIAVFGGTPLGHAVSQLYADNSDRVDGFHATGTPQANRIVALNGSANLPTGALPPGTLRGSIAKSDSTNDSARNEKWVMVECPTGMWAVGGGYAIDNASLSGAGNVLVTTNAPANAGPGNPPAFGWYVAAKEVPASSDPNVTWQLNGWVVCVNHQH